MNRRADEQTDRLAYYHANVQMNRQVDRRAVRHFRETEKITDFKKDCPTHGRSNGKSKGKDGRKDGQTDGKTDKGRIFYSEHTNMYEINVSAIMS